LYKNVNDLKYQKSWSNQVGSRSSKFRVWIGHFLIYLIQIIRVTITFKSKVLEIPYYKTLMVILCHKIYENIEEKFPPNFEVQKEGNTTK